MIRKVAHFYLLLLFYVNICIYVGGQIWPVKDEHPQWDKEASSVQLGQYHGLIQKYARRHGLDWRFVYSMIEAESSFRKDVVSSAGAVGLMQIMPVVAYAEGVTNMEDPEENVRAGVRHFRRFFDVLKGETVEDTLKINLAVYNAGISHVRDAKKLARLLGMNPRKWKSLEKTLPLLEKEEFLPFVDAGYCQGQSVVAYVRKVFQRYQYYRKIHPDYPLEIKQL